MWPNTSEAHDLGMNNVYQAQQRVSDIRQAREADARNRRLRKDGRAAMHETADPVDTVRHHHLLLTFRRHSLASR